MQKRYLFCVVAFLASFLEVQSSFGWLKGVVCCAGSDSVMDERETGSSHTVALSGCLSNAEVPQVDCRSSATSVIIFPPGCLLQAVECGSIALVRSLVASGADINHGERGYTPLGVACHYKNYQMVQHLIECAGADPNRGGVGNWTPLMVAACNGATNVVHLLWSNGACINQKSDIDGVSALHLACQGGHSDCVQLLLHAGAQVNQANNRGVTPLLSATIAKKKDSVSLLLKAGADPAAASTNQWTPLWVAAKNGCADIVQLLLDKGVNPNTVGPRETSVSNIAAYKGHQAIVKMLYNAGADIEHCDTNGATLLYCALKGGDIALAHWLVEHGADTNMLYEERRILDVLPGDDCIQQKSLIMQALHRGFYQYTIEQLAVFAIGPEDAGAAKNKLHQAMAVFCFEGNDRNYFPRDLHFLIGSLVGGALAQRDACFEEPH